MQYYDKDQFIKKLDITESLFKKYSAQLVKEGYVFITDAETGKRTYSDKDITTFEQIAGLKKSMHLDQAIKEVVKGNSVSVYNSVTPESINDKLDLILGQQLLTNSRIEALEKENQTLRKEVLDRMDQREKQTALFMEEWREEKRIKADQERLRLETAATTTPGKKKSKLKSLWDKWFGKE